MTSIKSLFKSRAAFRDLAILTSGSMAAQIVSFLLYPIITRLFVPEDVGTLSLFMSFVFVSISLAPFQMDQLLLVSRSASESKKIIGMAILFGLVTISAIWGAISIFKGVTTESFSRVPWLAIAAFPLFTLPLIFYQQMYTFAIREKIFIAAASASSTAQVTATILKIGIGFFRPTLGTLFISELAYSWLCLVNMWMLVKTTWQTVQPDSLRIHREILRHAKPLILHGQAAAVLRTLSAYFPIQYVGLIYSSVETGHFALSFALISALGKNLSQSLTHVFVNRFSELIRKDDIAASIKLFRKTILTAGLTGSVAAVLGTLYAPGLFDLLFGHKWHDVGLIFSPLLLVFLSGLLVLPSSAALRLIQRPKMIVFQEGAAALTWLCVFGAAFFNELNLSTALWITGTLQTAWSMIFCACTYVLIGRIGPK